MKMAYFENLFYFYFSYCFRLCFVCYLSARVSLCYADQVSNKGIYRGCRTGHCDRSIRCRPTASNIVDIVQIRKFAQQLNFTC